MDQDISLINRVKNYLVEKHEIAYCKRLEYNNENGYFELKWELNDLSHPLIMMGDFLSEEDFFLYICKEIDNKRIFLTKYFILRMEEEPVIEESQCETNTID